MKTGFYDVFILRSENDPPHFYTGFTGNLDARLAHHNSGGDPHTAKYRAWRIKTAVAFTDREQALEFERYLKSPSGRAFAKKRLQSTQPDAAKSPCTVASACRERQ